MTRGTTIKLRALMVATVAAVFGRVTAFAGMRRLHRYQQRGRLAFPGPPFLVTGSSRDGTTISTRRQQHSEVSRPVMMVPDATTTVMDLSSGDLFSTTTESLSSSLLCLDGLGSMTQDTAEALAGPLFGASLFPYLVFLYFLNCPETDCPKGVTVGFACCLLFVFLTIPAAVAAKILYGVSLADCDWLHGSAESLLTITNLVTVVAFRQALAWREQRASGRPPPTSVVSYAPMTWLVVILTVLAGVTAAVPALAADTAVHTAYLGGFLDLPAATDWLANRFDVTEPANSLTVACWIIHVSSLVEFLVAMGFCWKWADVVQNPSWKGLTWGLLPLHSSGITACTYHVFYNSVSFLVPLQAFLTCVGNTTAAVAAYRIAASNGWEPASSLPSFLSSWIAGALPAQEERQTENGQEGQQDAASLVGFEDLGQALAEDSDYTFLIKLFVGCAMASYFVKYGELFLPFPFQHNLPTALSIIAIPSALNAFKWYKRSQDATFEGWF